MKKLWIPTLLTISLTPMVSIVSCKKPDKPEPEITPTGINLDVSELNLEVGQSSTLTATVEPEGASQDVEWSVECIPSETEVVTVNNGKVTAVGEGDATIIAKPKGYDIPATCSVHVTQPEIPPTKINLFPSTLELEPGEKDIIDATVEPAGAYDEVEWSISGNAYIEGFDSWSCDVRGCDEGTATVTAKSKKYRDVSATCEVIISEKHVDPEEIVLNETKLTLEVGQTFQLEATVLPEGASQEVFWNVDQTSDVISVDRSTGFVTAIGYGKAIVNVYSTEKSGVSASCAIIVKRPPTPAPTGDYLSITSDKESTVQVFVGGDQVSESNLPNIQYWDGSNWQEATFTGSGTSWSFETEADAENNYTVFLRGDNPEGLSQGDAGRMVKIACPDKNSDASWVVGGSIMALIDNGVEIEDSTIPNEVCFGWLFANNNNIIEVEQGLLPATTLTKKCYDRTFFDCSNLTNVPDLPATTLPSGAYYAMFSECTSLVDIPEELPAKQFGNSSCIDMFDGCTSLTTTCALSTGNLGSGCFSGMFKDCPNLQTIKKITVGDNYKANAFKGMFSIITTPQSDYAFYEINSDVDVAIDLSACQIAGTDCFSDMFAGREGIQQPELGKKYCFSNVAPNRI